MKNNKLSFYRFPCNEEDKRTWLQLIKKVKQMKKSCGFSSGCSPNLCPISCPRHIKVEGDWLIGRPINWPRLLPFLNNQHQSMHVKLISMQTHIFLITKIMAIRLWQCLSQTKNMPYNSFGKMLKKRFEPCTVAIINYHVPYATINICPNSSIIC